MAGLVRGLRRAAASLAAAAVLWCGAAAAQDYPTKPIKFIVPYTPGGGVDIMIRAIGEKLAAALGQPVVQENRPGAGAAIGAELAAKSPPDGYTLLAVTNGAMTTNTALYKDLKYDPLKDFAPITLLASHTVVLVVNADLPVANIAELIALAKSKPGTLSGGSSGNGSTMHLAHAFLNKVAGVDIAHVPYRGSALAMAAVASGELQMSFMDIGPALPVAKAGKARMIGIIGAERSVVAPDVPTMQEAGLKGFDFVTWSGIFAPAGTPKDIVAKLNAELRRILADPEIKQRVITIGGEPLSSTPEELAAKVRSEMPMWTALVRDAGAKAE
jgi:tripartite-type tricarboxylate transporter receptor subunit TctC